MQHEGTDHCAELWFHLCHICRTLFFNHHLEHFKSSLWILFLSPTVCDISFRICPIYLPFYNAAWLFIRRPTNTSHCHWLLPRYSCLSDVFRNSKANGGLEVLSYDTLNNVFKINWITRYLKKDDMWSTFLNFLFKLVGGFEFLLKCHYSIDKIPVKLVRCHQQALMAWILAYKHNFPLRRYYIWNNKDILYKHKYIYIWFDNNIVLVSQLINRDGGLLLYTEFGSNPN